MKIELVGSEPRVFIDRDVADDILAISSIVKNKISLFLRISCEGDDVFIKGFRIPKQNATDYIDSISEEELDSLGSKSDGEEYFIGICMVGAKVEKSIVKADMDFFKKSFNGLKRYICMHMNNSGEMEINIRNDNLIFMDVKTFISPSKVQDIENLKKDIKEKISSIYGGYYVTERKVHLPSKLLEDNTNWRDVV